VYITGKCPSRYKCSNVAMEISYIEKQIKNEH